MKRKDAEKILLRLESARTQFQEKVDELTDEINWIKKLLAKDSSEQNKNRLVLKEQSKEEIP